VLSKEDYIHILMQTSLCLHYEPDFRIDKPMLMLVGDQDNTGNIRKVMPLWARHDGVKLFVIPHAKHAANLDQPELFHKHLLEFLPSLK
jgi:pimeloyl-ACP methyl ester carboxylesterase